MCLCVYVCIYICICYDCNLIDVSCCFSSSWFSAKAFHLVLSKLPNSIFYGCSQFSGSTKFHGYTQ